MSTVRAHVPVGPGTQISRYTIESFLGAGGMGDVYAALDGALGRTVALKILTAARAADPRRVQRFLREAHAASSLNHPAIVSIFDSGTAVLSDGLTVYFLAMELVDGMTLSTWSRSPRPVEKIAEVMSQVADGLAAAHASGLVHRDLKPDNIMVARGGYAKILDFGIAKLTDRCVDEPQRTDSSAPCDTAPAEIFGTASYMSPEQVLGRNVDHRSDIFSFGSVLYELFTGRPAFRGSTPIETMNSVATLDPLAQKKGMRELAPQILRIIRRCLAKDPEDRYQSIKDVALDLREAVAGNQELVERPRGLRSLWRWIVGAAAVLGIALLSLTFLGDLDRRSRRSDAAPAVPPPINMSRMTNTGKVISAAISPDARYLVYASVEGENQTVWVKQIATNTNVRLIAPLPIYYTEFKFSPDGNYICYGSSKREEPNVVDLYQMPALGGEARKIADDIDGWFAISPDGSSVAFRRFSALDRVYAVWIANLETGVERAVLRQQFPDYVGNLAWSPDGTRLAFVGAATRTTMGAGIFELHLDTGRISKMAIPSWPGIGSFVWLTDGSGLLLNAYDTHEPAQIWFVPFNGGKARKITSDLSEYGSITVSADSKSFVASRSEDSVNIWLVPLEPQGKPRALTVGLGNRFGGGGVCFVGRSSILFTDFPGLNVMPADGGQPRRITRGETRFWNPVISPDGTRLAFMTDKSGHVEIWTSQLDGSDMKQVTTGWNSGVPSWFPDGKSIAYVTAGAVQAAWRVNLDSGTPVRLTQTPVNWPHVSPDGRSMLCRMRSTQPGVPLWRTALIPLDHKGPPKYFAVPKFGPQKLQWMPDGQSFLFADTVGGVANVWIQDLRGGQPRQLTHFDSGMISAFDVSPDGKSLVIARDEPVNDAVLIRDFR